MRPAAIEWFEKIVIATILLGFVNLGLTWPEVTQGGTQTAYVVTIAVVISGAMLALALLISRGRNSVAKWIFAIFAASALFSLFWSGVSFEPVGIVSVIRDLATVIAAALLFTPSVRKWFNDRGVANQAPTMTR